MKETPGDIILHMCTTNDNHMMYSSWDIECEGQNFLSFWTIFYIFTAPNNPKNRNFQKVKKPPGDIIILHMCIMNDNHMMSGSWDMECDFLCHFGLFFALLPP